MNEKLIEMFKEQTNTLIIGKKRSGKTCLGMVFAKYMGDENREIYVYRHPKPEVLKKLPFRVTNLNNIKQLSNLKNAVILIDEAHKHFSIWDKAVNTQLRDILSISGQNNTCFIFVTHNSFFLNRSLFSFIDIKIIKEVNDGHFDLERPFMKKLYENLAIVGIENFFLDTDDYRGRETFEKPQWYTDEISFSYRNDKEVDFFSKVDTARTDEKSREKNASENAEKTNENARTI